jgi:hypothetical protein
LIKELGSGICDWTAVAMLPYNEMIKIYVMFRLKYAFTFLENCLTDGG